MLILMIDSDGVIQRRYISVKNLNKYDFIGINKKLVALPRNKKLTDIRAIQTHL